MTVFSNDLVRCKITLNDLLNLTHSKGIDSCAYPTEDQPENEFYLRLICSDTDPHNPENEKYKEDIERELTKLKIVQDRIRTHAPHRLFNPIPSIIKETILDEKVFAKENRYDILLDNATNVHRLSRTGKLFGTIETV